MNRVLASATVDKLRDGPVPLWEVTVWGEPPHQSRRIYSLEMKSDSDAAMEGIRLFVDEVECLAEGAGND